MQTKPLPLSKDNPLDLAQLMARLSSAKTPEDIEAIQKQIAAINRQIGEQLQAKGLEVSSARAPLFKMLDEFRALEATIERAKKKLVANQEGAAKFDKVVESQFEEDNSGAAICHCYIVDAFMGIRHCADIARRLERWLEVKARELTALEERIFDYADERQLAYLLPIEFAAKRAQ